MINMHPETVEAISIVLEGLKISQLSDMLWDSDDLWHFNRAMYVVLARYCYRKSSVRLSVRLSVTLMYRGRMG